MRRRLALLAALALLGACRDEGVRPTTTLAALDSADQVMVGFDHVVTRNGVRQSEITADTAYFYDATQTTRLHRMTVVFFDSAGAQTGTLTAKRGLYRWQPGTMDAESTVVLRSADGRLLRTERLLYDAQKKELRSAVPFTYDYQGNHIEGTSFVSDTKFERVTVDRPKGLARKPVLLPGQ